MSSTNPTPASGSGSGGSGPTQKPSKVSAMRIKAAAASTFTVPSGTHLEALSGQNWSVWSGTIGVLLQLNEVEDILTHDTSPSGVDADKWSSIQRKTMAYLHLHCTPDVFSIVESEVDFPMFKDKFDRLRETYSGTGSTAIFNLWIELMQARLDEGSPLAPQLAKLNEACVKLSNANMIVSDLQYCLILLNALPKSYEVVASTLLASSSASSLKYNEITARILNEEGRKSGPSASLNAAHAPVKSGKKKKKEEGGADSGRKAANAHVLVHSSASIEEVSDNNEFRVALYSAVRTRWMMDSGATHHMSPYKTDFADYAPCQGTVRLGDKSTDDQVGMGSIVFK